MKVLLIDDHALFRHGVRLMLSGLSQEIEIEESDSVANSLAILDLTEFDLALLDLKLSDTNGIDSLLCIRDRYPELPIIVLSGEQDPLVIHKAIAEGAMGFISKSADHEELLAAIRHIFAGGIYLPKEVIVYSGGTTEAHNDLVAGRNGTDLLGLLSKRQREVLHCLLQGKSNKAISSMLGIAENTVKNHIATILLTLGASNRTEVVYLAARAGVPLEWQLKGSGEPVRISKQ